MPLESDAASGSLKLPGGKVFWKALIKVVVSTHPISAFL